MHASPFKSILSDITPKMATQITHKRVFSKTVELHLQRIGLQLRALYNNVKLFYTMHCKKEKLNFKNAVLKIIYPIIIAEQSLK